MIVATEFFTGGKRIERVDALVRMLPGETINIRGEEYHATKVHWEIENPDSQYLRTIRYSVALFAIADRPPTDDEEQARRDAELLGCGYTVDGVRVHPGRIRIYGLAAAPTADLMRLVEELNELAETHYDAGCCNASFPILSVRRAMKDAATALSALGEARVGEEAGDTIRSGTFEWWVIRCPGYPDPISFGKKEDALGLIRRYGDERTFLSCWWRQANRHDYTPEETRAMTATLTAPGAEK